MNKKHHTHNPLPILNLLLALLLLATQPFAYSADAGSDSNSDRKAIEAAMRKINARRYYLKLGYANWPKCQGCGGGYSIASPMPADGFYGNVDDVRMAELVNALKSAFFLSGPELYEYFADTKSGDPIEGHDINDWDSYTSADFPFNEWPGAPTIDQTNYRAAFDVINGYIDDLVMINPIEADQVGTTNNDPTDNYPEYNDGASRFMPDPPGYGNELTCAQAKASASDSHDTSDGSTKGWEYEPWTTVDYQIGSYAAIYANGYAAYQSDPAYDDYEAYLGAARGRIYVDLTDHTGTAKVYLAVDHIDYLPGQAVIPPSTTPVTSDEKYHAWEDASPGDLWFSSVLADAMPTWPPCPPAPDDDEHFTYEDGWHIMHAIVAISPHFNVDKVLPPISCNTCSGGTCTISTNSENGCIAYTIDLGKHNNGDGAGYLLIYADVPSDELATPDTSILQSFLDSGVTENTSSGMLDDIYTGEYYVYVDVDSASRYQLRIFLQSDSLEPGFDPETDTNWLKQITVENPDTLPTNNRLLITEETGPAATSSVTTASMYEYDEETDTWKLGTGYDIDSQSPSHGMAQKWEARQKGAWYTDQVDGYEKYDETYVIIDDNSVAGPSDDYEVYREVKTYTKYPWGVELTKQVVDPSSAAETTQWYYYDNEMLDGDNYSHLMAMRTPTGYWERYDYDDDNDVQDGFLLEKITQLNSTPFTEPDTTTQTRDISNFTTNNLVTEYAYQSVDLSSDTDTVSETITEVIESVSGNPVSTRYTVTWSGTDSTSYGNLYEIWDIDCPTPDPKGAGTIKAYLEDVADGAASARISKVWKHATDDLNNGKHKGDVAIRSNADGTWTFYSRSSGTSAFDSNVNATFTVTSSGYLDPNSANAPHYEDPTDDIPSGTEVVQGNGGRMAVDSQGNLLYSTRERVEYGGSWFYESLTVYTDPDALGRPQQLDYYFGQEAADELATPSGTAAYSTYKDYACCGISTSTDRAGRVTGYDYDALGRTTDVTQPSGVSTHTTYDAAGRTVLVQRISDDGLDTIDQRNTEYDLLGRVVWTKDALGNYTFYTYNTVTDDGTDYDPTADPPEPRYDEVRVYPHAHDSTAPVQVTWTDPQGRVVRRWSGTSSSSWDGDTETAPPGTETLTEVSRTMMAYDWAGRVTSERTYFDLASIGISGEGTEGTNYYESTYDYDALGRRWKSTDAMGNVTINVYDNAGRMTEQWVGTEDTDTGATPDDPSNSGANDMAMVTKLFYDTDGDGTGDPVGYVTRQYRPKSIATKPATLSTDYVYTNTLTDWDDTNELRTVKTMPQSGAGPWTYQVYDFQGRQSAVETYENDSGVEGDLLAKTTYSYDSTTGNLDSMKVYEVNSGTPGDYIETTYFYEDAGDGGRLVKTATSGGGFTKTAFDAHGRTARTVTGSVEGSNTDADAFTDDILLTETVYTYDDNDNVTQAASYERNHDASTGTTGLLSEQSNDGESRVTYRATWYDELNRPAIQADYGTNGGNGEPSYWPTSPPSNGTNSVNVTTTAYDAAGRVSVVTDNSDTDTAYYYDDMGRQIYIVENPDDFDGTDEADAGDASDSDVDRVTQFAYNAASQITEQTALMNSGTTDDQTTAYTYGGDNGTDCPVYRKDLLVKIKYPDGDDVDDNIQMTYYADGSLATRTDQRGVELAYGYDDAGRREYQKVASGTVDGDQRVQYAYTALGQLDTITTYDDKDGGSGHETSQVEYEYNGLGQLLKDRQDHDSVVDATSTNLETQEVVYAYEPAVSGVFTKGSRLDTVTYPNGRVIHRIYSGHDGIDDAIGRANGIAKDSSGSPGDSIVEYTYLGSGRMVRKDYPAPDVRLDYIDESGEGDIANDPYDASLDRYGRVIRQQWETYDTSNNDAGNGDYFNITYGYDPAGNRLYADRQVYKSHAQYYAYDGLHRLTNYQAGKMTYDGTPEPDGVASYWNLNGRTWGLDQLGNQLSITTPDASAKFTNAIEDGQANEYTAHSVKSDVGVAKFSDGFSSDTIASGQWEKIGTDTYDISGGNLNIIAINNDTASDPSGGAAILIKGEAVGPFRAKFRVTFPSGTGSGQAGLILGYDEQHPNDYWLYVADLSDGKVKLIQVVNGVKQTAQATEDITLSAGTAAGIYMASKRFTANAEYGTDFEFDGSGFPTGRIGLWADAPNVAFDSIDVSRDAPTDNLAGRWINPATAYIHDTGSGEGRLAINTTIPNTTDPVLLDGVRAQRFQATFTMRRESGSTVSRGCFVLAASDTDDYIAVKLTHSSTGGVLPEVYEVSDGHNRTLITSSSDSATDVPAITNADDPLYVRITCDGTNLTVRFSANGTFTDYNDCYTTTTAYADLTRPGGMFGFMGGSKTIYFDDFVLKADRDDDIPTNGYEETEYADNFNLDSGYTESTPAYDAAGNLVFDGMHQFTYDAWNRLVKVEHAYTDPDDTTAPFDYLTGSKVADMAYDGLGRRIKKTVINSANLDCTYHYYYDGQSVIQIDNGAPSGGEMLKQFVWGLQYVDELCQIGINQDPSNADTETYAENECEYYYYPMQDANYNVMGVITEAGRLAERYEYTPYGQRTVYSHGVIPGDVNADGYVGLDDLQAIQNNWNADVSGPDPADISGDGYIGSDDLQVVLDHWNQGIAPATDNDPLTTYPTLTSARYTSNGAADMGPALCEVGHQGLFHDEEFGAQGGLINNRARTLPPRLGRFMQRDPLGYVDGMNAYQYEMSIPLRYGDPTGYTSCCGMEIGPCLKKLALRLNYYYHYKWSEWDRQKICAGRYDPDLGWDIFELAWQKSNFHDASANCGSGSCADTVQVFGTCYKAHHVNYILWGQLTRLCRSNIHPALRAISLHRMMSDRRGDPGDQDPLKDQIEGRQLWAYLGWKGQFRNIDNKYLKRGIAEQTNCGNCPSHYDGRLEIVLNATIPLESRYRDSWRLDESRLPYFNTDYTVSVDCSGASDSYNNPGTWSWWEVDNPSPY